MELLEVEGQFFDLQAFEKAEDHCHFLMDSAEPFRTYAELNVYKVQVEVDSRDPLVCVLNGAHRVVRVARHPVKRRNK